MLNSNGYDLVFATDPACNYLVNWDSETVNNTGSAQANYWVRVPSLSNTTDTVFYMCYGNAAITAYQGVSTGTWDSNFFSVYHTPNGSVLSGNDSTTNDNTASSVGSPSATSGIVDGGMGTTGSMVQGIQTTNGFSAPGDWTVEVWINTTTDAKGYFQAQTSNCVIICQVGNAFIAGTANAMNCTVRDDGGSLLTAQGSATVDDGNWHLLSAVRSTGNNIKLYVDGNLDTTTGYSPSDGFTCSSSFNLGFISSISSLVGSEDEYRISTTSRSSDWLKTEYNTAFSPSTFLNFDTEVNNKILSENEKGIVLDGGKMTLRGGRLTVR